jgi:hypothetical protein
MGAGLGWSVSGPYFETCNCVAVCPCRRQDGRPGGRSTFGVCQFLLIWRVAEGRRNDLDLSGRTVAMAGFYADDEEGSPWRVILYVDRDAAPDQRDALAEIFLGKAGGDIFFTSNIAEVIAVRSADIEIDFTLGREHARIEEFADARTDRAADFDGIVSCGIPGHHHPGKEMIVSASHADEMLQWSYEGRCGFSTDYAYSG